MVIVVADVILVRYIVGMQMWAGKEERSHRLDYGTIRRAIGAAIST